MTETRTVSREVEEVLGPLEHKPVRRRDPEVRREQNRQAQQRFRDKKRLADALQVDS